MYKVKQKVCLCETSLAPLELCHSSLVPGNIALQWKSRLLKLLSLTQHLIEHFIQIEMVCMVL